MKRTNKFFAFILAVCLLCAVGIPIANAEKATVTLTTYAASADQKLSVPVEFKKVSEEKAWEKSHTNLGMEYKDNVHTLTSGTTLS